MKHWFGSQVVLCTIFLLLASSALAFDFINQIDCSSVCNIPVEDKPYNEYWSGVGTVGSKSLKVSGDASSYTSGSQFFIIQMQDAECNFGEVVNYHNTGKYELNTLSSISYDKGTDQSTLTFEFNLINNYRSAAGEKSFQVVYVPSCGTLNLLENPIVPEWNGETGGIFVSVSTVMNMNSRMIDVSGKGFRGKEEGICGSGNRVIRTTKSDPTTIFFGEGGIIFIATDSIVNPGSLFANADDGSFTNGGEGGSIYLVSNDSKEKSVFSNLLITAYGGEGNTMIGGGNGGVVYATESLSGNVYVDGGFGPKGVLKGENGQILKTEYESFFAQYACRNIFERGVSTQSASRTRSSTRAPSSTRSSSGNPDPTRTRTTSATNSPSVTISYTRSQTPSQTNNRFSATPTTSTSPTHSDTKTPTSSASLSKTISITASPSRYNGASQTPFPSRTPDSSSTASRTISRSSSETISVTRSATPTHSVTKSVTASASLSPTKDATLSLTPTRTHSDTPSQTKSFSPSVTPSKSFTNTRTPTRSITVTKSPSRAV